MGPKELQGAEEVQGKKEKRRLIGFKISETSSDMKSIAR
jgi:hypothetical protein